MKIWALLFFPILVWAAYPSQSMPTFCLDVESEKPIQFHEATYRLGWDIHFSPYAGGEDVLFVHRGLERLEGLSIGKSPVAFSRRAEAVIWRISELVLLYLPLNYLANVVQHEIFGHGYRIRDIDHGAKVLGYTFGTPPPFGPGGAATSYQVPGNFTSTDESAVAMAGVESTAILALETKWKWLESMHIDPRQTVLYLLGQYDISLYIGSLKGLQKEQLQGHDMKAYIRSVNWTYTSGNLKGARLRSLSWINLADPFTYYSIYAWFRYISTGQESGFPMIPVWNYGYLPGLRLGLTPFGPEIFLENFLESEHNIYYFYLKYGKHAGNDYYGLGFYVPRVVYFGEWSLGARFDAWLQPHLLLLPGNVLFPFIHFANKPNPNDPLYPLSLQQRKAEGLSASIIAAYKSSGRSGAEIELGYKSQGFLPGNALRAQPIARVYYTLFF